MQSSLLTHPPATRAQLIYVRPCGMSLRIRVEFADGLLGPHLAHLKRSW
jgi:hypothetical protein